MKVFRNLIALLAMIAGPMMLAALVLLALGHRPFILKSESMEPLYARGSLCLIDTRVPLDQLTPGDVIAYRSPANSLVFHRLIDISASGESARHAVLQGDANSLAQEIELSSINYIGRESFTIPRLGAIIDQLLDHVWILIIFFFILACIPWSRFTKPPPISPSQ